MSRLAKADFAKEPWRIHELTAGYTVEDVWSFRTPGAGPYDFPMMLTAMRAVEASAEQTRIVRLLFAVRWKIGALLGWDKRSAQLGERVAPLRDRLPEDLRNADRNVDSDLAPFTVVYELGEESARELANKTVHGVMHLGWVRNPSGDYCLHMAVLVKPNGALGRIYMVTIRPFRRIIVYPALTRRWERAWLDLARTETHE